MTYFAHARTALKYGLLNLGFKGGDKLLLPNYVCDALLHPIKSLGLVPVYYPVRDTFEPQWEALELLASKNTCRAIVMVHYFGQPQNIGLYREFCDAHGLLLLEDNAHGFGGMVGGKLLGTFGDLGISSPRKILSTASGGILYINGKEQFPPSLQPFRTVLVKRLIQQLFGRWPLLKVAASVLARRLPDFSNPSAFHEPDVGDMVADNNSDQVIATAVVSGSLPEMASLRRERWRAWQDMATHIGLVPVYDKVHPESSPWMFPAYVEPGSQSSRILKYCLKKGIILSPWPALPTEVIVRGGEPVDRWHRLVCAPLHQECPTCWE